MAERSMIFFASDVHLGLDVKDPAERERRFVQFLKSIPTDRTEALYLLGDIWDFWYEYKDVVPKGYVRVFSALTDIMDAGVKVRFVPGNHDIWCYDYFRSLGMEIISQPFFFQAGGKTFCVGHGDGLGPGLFSYKLLNSIFKNKIAQALFSSLHPWMAFRLAKAWSKDSRLSHNEEYCFKGEAEPLYKYVMSVLESRSVDYFIFGHFHTTVDMTLPNGSRLLIMKDWMNSSNYLYFDGIGAGCGNLEKIEK